MSSASTTPDRHDDRAVALALAASHLLERFRGWGEGVSANVGSIDSDPRRSRTELLALRRERALARLDGGDAGPLGYGAPSYEAEPPTF